ncbi:MAG: hypothetical protein WCI57_01575 [Candidatus Berkelbacteria bacterium]
MFKNLQKYTLLHSEWLIGTAIALLFLSATATSVYAIAKGNEARFIQIVRTRDVARSNIIEPADLLGAISLPAQAPDVALTTGQAVTTANSATSAKTAKSTKVAVAEGPESHLSPTIVEPSVPRPRPETYELRQPIEPLDCEKVVFGYDENLDKVEMGQRIHIGLKGSSIMLQPVSWSGGGVFEKKDDSSLWWHSDVSGKYEISLTASTGDSGCTKSRVIEVLPLPDYVKGLGSVSIGNQLSAYVLEQSGIQQISFGVGLYDINGRDIIGAPRQEMMPLKTKVEITYGKGGKVLYTRIFSDDVISGAFPNKSAAREIIIPVKDIDMKNVYYWPDGWTKLYITATVTTPTQGDFVAGSDLYVKSIVPVE